MKFLKESGGNLMIESIVAISVTVIGFLGVVGLLSRSISVNKDAGQKFVSTYLSAEGIEVVKSLIDKNYVRQSEGETIPWNGGIRTGNYEVSYDSASLGADLGGLSATPLSFDKTTGIYSYNAGATPSIFKRTVNVTEQRGGNELRVISRVLWSDRGVDKSIELEDHFFNWRE